MLTHSFIASFYLKPFLMMPFCIYAIFETLLQNDFIFIITKNLWVIVLLHILYFSSSKVGMLLGRPTSELILQLLITLREIIAPILVDPELNSISRNGGYKINHELELTEFVS